METERLIHVDVYQMCPQFHFNHITPFSIFRPSRYNGFTSCRNLRLNQTTCNVEEKKKKNGTMKGKGSFDNQPVIIEVSN